MPKQLVDSLTQGFVFTPFYYFKAFFLKKHNIMKNVKINCVNLHLYSNLNNAKFHLLLKYFNYKYSESFVLNA